MSDIPNGQPDKQSEQKQTEKPPEYERFESGLRRALSVPKVELDKRQAEYDRKREAAKEEK